MGTVLQMGARSLCTAWVQRLMCDSIWETACYWERILFILSFVLMMLGYSKELPSCGWHNTQPLRTQVQVPLLENWDFSLSRVLLLTLGSGKQGKSLESVHIAFVPRDVAKKPGTESIHGYREIRRMASAENKWTIAMSRSFFREFCSDRNRSSRSLLEFWQTTKPAVRASGSVNSSRLARHPEALL